MSWKKSVKSPIRVGINTVAHRLYNHGETAVICFALAMLMRGVQDPEERDKRVRLVHLKTVVQRSNKTRIHGASFICHSSDIILVSEVGYLGARIGTHPARSERSRGGDVR